MGSPTYPQIGSNTHLKRAALPIRAALRKAHIGAVRRAVRTEMIMESTNETTPQGSGALILQRGRIPESAILMWMF